MFHIGRWDNNGLLEVFVDLFSKLEFIGRCDRCSVLVSYNSWNHKVLEGIEDLKEIKSSCRP